MCVHNTSVLLQNFMIMYTIMQNLKFNALYLTILNSVGGTFRNLELSVHDVCNLAVVYEIVMQ